MAIAKKKKITTAEKLNAIIQNNDEQKLKDFLNEQYAQDLGPVIEKLDSKNKIKCFKLLNITNAANVYSEFSLEFQKELLKDLGPDQLAPIIAEMDDDDATDLIIQLPEDEKSNLLKLLPDPIQQAQVQELSNYPPESAGGIMSTDFLRLRSDMTVNLAFNYVRRQAAEYHTQIHYLYVVDNTNKLAGVITLRDLILAPLNDLIANHMNTEIISCKVTDDQETVANTISKYDLIAIPVTDEEGILKGIVTIDDVVDVLKKETTEDIYQSSGISDVVPSDELISGKVTYSVRARLPWLLMTLVGQTIAAIIIASYGKTIASAPLAISFMPLLSGLSGNIGGQTSTIIVRGLVTGNIELKNTAKHIFHEFKIGFFIGIICAVITGAVAWHMYNLPALGLIVGFALCCSMIAGVLLGTITPIMLQSINKDPAAASSPFITTLLDVLTFTFYLGIVSYSLKYIR